MYNFGAKFKKFKNFQKYVDLNCAGLGSLHTKFELNIITRSSAIMSQTPGVTFESPCILHPQYSALSCLCIATMCALLLCNLFRNYLLACKIQSNASYAALC